MPEKYDKAVIMEGDEKGEEGTVISIANGNGIIKNKDGRSYEVELNRTARKVD